MRELVKELEEKHGWEVDNDFLDNNEEFLTALVQITQQKQVKNNDLLHSVIHCSKGRLAEEFQKGYKEGYEDGANAAANDIAANPHKMC